MKLMKIIQRGILQFGNDILLILPPMIRIHLFYKMEHLLGRMEQVFGQVLTISLNLNCRLMKEGQLQMEK